MKKLTDEMIEKWLEDYSNDKSLDGKFEKLVRKVWALAQKEKE